MNYKSIYLLISSIILPNLEPTTPTKASKISGFNFETPEKQRLTIQDSPRSARLSKLKQFVEKLSTKKDKDFETKNDRLSNISIRPKSNRKKWCK